MGLGDAMVEQWMSDELKVLSGKLTGQQWAGITRIVQAELEGKSVNALLDGGGKICARSTYYGRWAKDKDGKAQRGWVDNADFVQALEWARRDYRTWLMEHSTAEAMAILGRASVSSARDLERQVAGDPEAIDALCQALDVAVEAQSAVRVQAVALSLASTGLPGALPALRRALAVDWEDDGVFTALAEAVARIAAPLEPDRQKAAFGILDRADIKTAAKGTVNESGGKSIVFDLSGLPADLLRSITDAGEQGGADS